MALCDVAPNEVKVARLCLSVEPLTLGVGADDGSMVPIIRRGRATPTREARV